MFLEAARDVCFNKEVHETNQVDSLPDREPRRFCRTPEDFEDAAADWMRYWGFRDVQRSLKGPDGGVDVVSREAVAQVKSWMVPIGRPEVQQLRGVAYRGEIALFFSLMTYTKEALDFAAASKVALFRFTGYDGQLEAVNERAYGLLQKFRNPGAFNESDELYKQVRAEADEAINKPGTTVNLLVEGCKDASISFYSDEECLYAVAQSEIGTLNSVQVRCLRSLGWEIPKSEEAGFYCYEWRRPIESKGVAEMITQTLRSVYKAEEIVVEKFFDDLAEDASLIPSSAPAPQKSLLEMLARQPKFWFALIGFGYLLSLFI